MTAVRATPHKIVFLDRDSLIATVRAPAFAHEWAEYPHTKGSEQTVERLQDATIAISNKVPLRAAELAQLPKLKMIAVAATGTDIIDLAACRERGILVTNIRDYARATVPEHTLALMLALRRQLVAYRADVEAGLWQASERFCLFSHPIRDLAGSRLGLLGYGALGKSVAQLARAFGMQVAVHNRSPINEADVLEVSKEELLATSDIVSLHLPLTDKTRNIIATAELASMKPTALLINTARGGLVDETALAHALQAGVIAGAGFDVLSKEPPPADNVLLNLRLPNFILTPHTAWASGEAMQKLADQLIANMEAFERGAPTNLVA
ncbi:D-2-hydroxyacid dehydrogenase [Janthinobacterium sp.]|uniref:D-2-hydroxyacid dehydrogenase n=1 Tax=Janthinobacterium sp. TaxID=1871054 RepID=UPI00261F34A5|nr:D-2-hydroxyacid dehydrogenase [Janthinobacterium sp.]